MPDNAHARRKFVELHTTNKSQIAEAGIQYFARLYEIEREVKNLDADERRRIRQARGRPIAEALHAWMIAQRLTVPQGSGTAKALNYSLKRWAALTRYLDDGSLPADTDAIDKDFWGSLLLKREMVSPEADLSRLRRSACTQPRPFQAKRAPCPERPSGCSRARGLACCLRGATHGRPAARAAAASTAGGQAIEQGTQLLVLDFEANPQGQDMTLLEAEHFVHEIAARTGRLAPSPFVRCDVVAHFRKWGSRRMWVGNDLDVEVSALEVLLS